MTEVVQARPERPVSDGPELASDGNGTGRTGAMWTPPRVLTVAAGVMVVQLVVRGWLAFAGVLSQNDLVVTGRSARMPLLSKEFLLSDDDRFAPLANLLTGAFTRVAALEYWPMAVTLVLFQALASLAMLRLLRLLLGDRPVLLLPLLLYLFSPLTLAAFDSWSTAVGALPLQAGLAWVCGDAITMYRARRSRYAVTGTLAFATALMFGEKAVVIPAVAFVVLALVLRQSGETSPLVASLRRGLWLWAGLVSTMAAFIWRFWSTVEPQSVHPEQSGLLATAVDAVGLSVLDGILPGLVGGPLSWSAIGLWADPPTVLVVAAVVVSAVAISWVSWRRRGCGVIWTLLAAYICATVVTLVVGRLTTAAAAEFPLSLRYFADIVVVAAIAVALVARAPARVDTRRELLDRTERRDVAVLMAVCFLGLSLWSTVTYTQTRDTESTRDYLTNARQALRTAGAPLLDHSVPEPVVWGPAFPYNRVSRVFAPIGIETASSTDELRLLGPTGRLVDGRVSNERALFAGPVPACGYLVEGTRPTVVLLNGHALDTDWTVQLNYLASQSGWIEVSFPQGPPLRASVRKGANSVYMDLPGGGDSLTVSSETPNLALCVDSGLVGFLESAD